MKFWRTSLVVGAMVVSAWSAGAAATDAPKHVTKHVKVLQTGTAHEAFFGLSFDGKQGLAVGAGGSIAKSVDGGAKWTPVLQKATQLALLAVDQKGKYAVAVGQLGTILVEAAPGRWVGTESGSKSRLLSVDVNSGGLAIAAGEFGAILKSSDGGRSWASVAPDWSSFVPGGAEPHMYSAQVSEAGEVTVAGEFGLILRSSDGGSSWQVLRSGDAATPSVFALYLGADGVGFAVGQSGSILASADGGATWTAVSSGTGANLLGVTIAPGGRVVITGMRALLISSDGGKTWNSVVEGDTATAWYQAVRTVEPGGSVLAVGHTGRIIRID